MTAFGLPGVPPVTQRAVTSETLALLAGAWREACARRGIGTAA